MYDKLVDDVIQRMKDTGCSLSKACKRYGKKRRTLYRFKALYHLRILDHDKYKEVSTAMNVDNVAYCNTSFTQKQFLIYSSKVSNPLLGGCMKSAKDM